MALTLQNNGNVSYNFTVAAANTVTQGAVVVGSTSEIAMPAGANAANVVGIALEDAAAAAQCDVGVSGVFAAICSEAISPIGVPLTVNGTTGKVEEADADNEDIVGVAMSTTGADGDEVLVLLRQGSFNTA